MAGDTSSLDRPLLPLDLLLDLEAVPLVRVDVGYVDAVLLGLGAGSGHLALRWGLVPADGELWSCCCTLQSAASLMVKLQVVVLPENAHNTATLRPPPRTD